MFSVMSNRFALAALLFSAIVLGQAGTPTSSAASVAPTSGYCYTPNGLSAQNDRPCVVGPGIEQSMCCPIGWTCMTNKMCVVTDPTLALAQVGSIRRGTCTNPQWNETVCGDFCLDVPDGGDLVPCGDNKFACKAYSDDQSANCAANRRIFTLPVGEAQTVISVPAGSTATSLVPISSSRASVSGSASTRPSNSTTPVPDGEGSDNDNTTRNIIIGAVVGGVGVIAILVIGILLVLRRKRKTDKKERAFLLETKAPDSGTSDVVDPEPANLPPTDYAGGYGGHSHETVPATVPQNNPNNDTYNDNETGLPTRANNQSPMPRNLSALTSSDLRNTSGQGRAMVDEIK